MWAVADPCRIWEGGGGGGGHNERCGYRLGRVVGGAAPGRMREGGTPPAQLGGMGELPHRGSGAEPQKLCVTAVCSH